MAKILKKPTSQKRKQELSIRVDGVSKSFKIPHEKHTSLKSAVINLFKKKGYDSFAALQDITFEVKKGEFLGIIGRNGSGKSTLLKILAGIYVADSGKISINGKLSPFLELGVGFNPQLSGRENIYLGGAVLGLSRKEIDEKYDEIVKFAEIEEFIDLKLSNYSSGMHVRLAFALAINVQAEILLMDEVLAVGDSNFQAKCINVFEKYKKMGKTVVLVSHDINAIEKYCDKCILLEKGNILSVGNAKTVVEYYKKQNLRTLDKSLQKINKNIITNNPNKPGLTITKAAFENSYGDVTETFRSGEDIILALTLDSKLGECEEINFGFGLYDENDTYLFSSSTISDNLSVESFIGQKIVKIILKQPTLNRGKYYVKASVVGKSFEDAEVYSFLEKSAAIHVDTLGSSDGILDLDHQWIIKK